MDDGVWASRAAMRDDSQRVTRLFRVYSIVCMDILGGHLTLCMCMRCFASVACRPDHHLGTGDVLTVTVLSWVEILVINGNCGPPMKVCNLQSMTRRDPRQVLVRPGAPDGEASGTITR